MCGRKTDLLLRVDDLHGQRLCIKLRIGNLKPHGRGVSEPLPRLRVGGRVHAEVARGWLVTRRVEYAPAIDLSFLTSDAPAWRKRTEPAGFWSTLGAP